jgi:hypothetical protein
LPNNPAWRKYKIIKTYLENEKNLFFFTLYMVVPLAYPQNIMKKIHVLCPRKYKKNFVWNNNFEIMDFLHRLKKILLFKNFYVRAWVMGKYMCKIVKTFKLPLFYYLVLNIHMLLASSVSWLFYYFLNKNWCGIFKNNLGLHNVNFIVGKGVYIKWHQIHILDVGEPWSIIWLSWFSSAINFTSYSSIPLYKSLFSESNWTMILTYKIWVICYKYHTT